MSFVLAFFFKDSFASVTLACWHQRTISGEESLMTCANEARWEHTWNSHARTTPKTWSRHHVLKTSRKHQREAAWSAVTLDWIVVMCATCIVTLMTRITRSTSVESGVRENRAISDMGKEAPVVCWCYCESKCLNTGGTRVGCDL